MHINFLLLIAFIIVGCSEKSTSTHPGNGSKEKRLTKEYNGVIQEADDYFSMRDIQSIYKAKELYNRAILIKPAEVYPRDRVAECDGRIQQYEDINKINNQCQKTQLSADKYFNEKNYDKAKSLYQKMLAACTDKTGYASSQIEKINKIISE